MRRLIVVMVCAAMVAGAAQAATADVAPGRYEGRTDQGQFLTFRVTDDRRYAIQVAVGSVVVFCPDESQPAVPIRKTSRSRRFRIDSKGRFTVRPASRTPAGDYVVRGRIKGRRATGTVRMKARVDANGEPSSTGETACDSGTVPWSAKLKK